MKPGTTITTVTDITGPEITHGGMRDYPYQLQGAVFDIATNQEYAANQEQAIEHLFSTKQLTGYRVFAEGEKIGSVDGFLVEDDSWTLRYVMVDTEKSASTRRLVIPPKWIANISRSKRTITLNRQKKQIEKSDRLQECPYQNLNP